MVAFYSLGGELVLIKVRVMVHGLKFALDNHCRAGIKFKDIMLGM